MAEHRNYEGIVLAAGYSTRMDDWKPGVMFNEYPIVVHTVKSMLDSCKKVVVVGGFNFDKLKNIFESGKYFNDSELENIVIVENNRFMEGMLSSVQFGIEHISLSVPGIFIIPGDIPFVKPATYKKLIENFEHDEKNQVVIPITLVKPDKKLGKAKLKRGHPILINKYVSNFIIKTDEVFVLREILGKFEQSFCIVDDNAIGFDIDKKEDLEKAKLLFENELNL